MELPHLTYGTFMDIHLINFVHFLSSSCLGVMISAPQEIKDNLATASTIIEWSDKPDQYYTRSTEFRDRKISEFLDHTFGNHQSACLYLDTCWGDIGPHPFDPIIAAYVDCEYILPGKLTKEIAKKLQNKTLLPGIEAAVKHHNSGNKINGYY